VFACTDQPAVNQNVAQDARTCGALVNVTDRSSSSDFSTMVLVRRPPLTISIHTGGASPALAKHLGACIGAMVGDEYPILARWLGDLRQTLQEQSRSQTERRQLYEAIIESDVLDLLREGQSNQAYGRFQSLIDTWAERA
jgi:precorrin-2 dehydrogenase/sirohydrochlorin ferrochelatase